jgi:hypothetical protein
MASEKEQREAAKAALREALAAYDGDTTQEVVVDAIAKLCSFNPTAAPTDSGSLLESQWILISAPNFPQGEKLQDGKFAYTLGRLAFNMFQPVNLKIVIDRVLQPVFPIDETGKLTHDIVVEFTTIDEHLPQLKGIVRNLGVAQPISDTTLQVKFTGGILAPPDLNQIDDWKTVFGKQNRSFQASWQEKLKFGLFQLIFGLVPSQSMNPKTGEISFTMQRSPKGKLEIIYLDEELRITRGNKETVLVCERQ